MKKKRTATAQAAAEGRCLKSRRVAGSFGQRTDDAQRGQDLFLSFQKAVIERTMAAEMNLHLGYRPGQDKPEGQANERNGASGKTLLTEHGPVRVQLPRDRDGSFAPILIPKHERRFTGFDDRIIAMYARGMSVREIQAFLAESYGTEVSPDFISSVTDEVMAETIAWQNRPLETMYPVVFFDALRVKIRDDGGVSNKAVYLALGIQADGQRDVLGLWVEQTEGPSSGSRSSMNSRPGVPGHPDRRGRRPEGPGRGHRHGLPAYDGADLHRASDPQQPGLRGLEGPQGRGRSPAPDLRGRQRTSGRAGAANARRWALGIKYPTIVAAWQRPGSTSRRSSSSPDIRRVIYTTNAIESLNMQLRKIIKTRGHFPNDEAAIKLLWLALRNVLAKSVRATFDWKAAMNQFAILFGERFTAARDNNF